MLGDNLLVAPIFNDESKGIFYLPKGTWTDFFTGEVMEGGTWIEKEYDYLHLPLMVKENSMIAIGSKDDRPDYDYADGVEIRIYALTEGEETSSVVYNMKSDAELTISAIKRNGEITIQASSAKPYTIRLVNMTGVAVSGASTRTEGNDTVIVPAADRMEVKPV